MTFPLCKEILLWITTPQFSNTKIKQMTINMNIKAIIIPVGFNN